MKSRGRRIQDNGVDKTLAKMIKAIWESSGNGSLLDMKEIRLLQRSNPKDASDTLCVEMMYRKYVGRP